ncbi:group-specific protein [Cytobacillus praedii]|uniref:group-specific protein n=1 Tax=Cytobacillus praedii TaxID=1742358 RepID=UPI002E22CAE5|nr:group-specific protein [Cytobacillus praedii]
MLSIELNKEEIEGKFLEELRKHLNEIQNQTVFWDMKELCRQTCMSEPFVKEQFFFDQRFQKFKVGRKWLFPAKEAELFLLQWIREQ